MKSMFTLLLINFSSVAFGQNFINGDLEGVVDQFNPNLDLTGWEYVPYTESFCDANWSGGATADITGPSGPITQYGISGNPYSGNTFISGLYLLGDTTIWHEGIQQTVSGFYPDNGYMITFYQANVKQITAPSSMATDESGGWSVYVDGILVHTSSSTSSTLTFDNNNLQWEYREFVFIPSDTVHTFAFLPADNDGSIDGAISEGLRMGIDDINIVYTSSLIEEPESNVKVFPNPTSENVSITFLSPVSGTISLIDSKGRLIKREVVVGSQGLNFIIDAPAGTYILEISNDDGTVDRVNVVKI